MGAFASAHLKRNPDGALVSHLAELVRGDFALVGEGPLIRPSGTFSPRGEGIPWGLLEILSGATSV